MEEKKYIPIILIGSHDESVRFKARLLNGVKLIEREAASDEREK